jgi:hypothetical protein
MNLKIKIEWIASFQFNHLNWKLFDENIWLEIIDVNYGKVKDVKCIIAMDVKFLKAIYVMLTCT